MNANSVVRSFIASYVRCRHLRGKIGEHKIADIPEDRTSTELPLTYVGLDMFGPFTVKQYRKEMKRYGITFNCLSSRVVHLLYYIEHGNRLIHSSTKKVYCTSMKHKMLHWY